MLTQLTGQKGRSFAVHTLVTVTLWASQSLWDLGRRPGSEEVQPGPASGRLEQSWDQALSGKQKQCHAQSSGGSHPPTIPQNHSLSDCHT